MRRALGVLTVAVAMVGAACSDSQSGSSPTTSAAPDPDVETCERELSRLFDGGELQAVARTEWFLAPFDDAELGGGGVLCTSLVPNRALAWIAIADSGKIVTFVTGEDGEPVRS